MRRNNINSILYEKIMRNISREVKRVLNEKDYYVDDYDYDSAVSVTGKLRSKIVVKSQTELSSIIRKKCKSVKNGVLDLRDIDVSNITRFTCLLNLNLSEAKNITVIDITGWDTSNAKDMRDMFYSCKYLTEIRGIENLNTSHVTNMAGMFCYCYSLKELNLSTWDVSNVEDMSEMFKGCRSLQELDVSNWDVRYVRDTSSIFLDVDKKIIKSKNLKK